MIFVKRSLIFLVIMIVLDYSAGRLFRYFFFRHDSLVSNHTTYVADRCNQDLLVFGSSHAFHHYVASQLADSTKLTCYNAGAAGYYMFYYYAMLKCVLHRYTPKVILLDIRAEEFAADPANYDRISVLLPYYERHPEIRSIIDRRSKYERVKLLFQTYPFNSQLLQIISKNIHKNDDEFKATDLLGFSPLTDTIPVSTKLGNKDYYGYQKIDTNLVNTYKTFIKDCQALHIKLYIFISPVLGVNRSKIKTVQIAARIADSLRVPFFDYSEERSLKKREYFSDYEHLNINGARAYTAMVAKNIIAK